MSNCVSADTGLSTEVISKNTDKTIARMTDKVQRLSSLLDPFMVKALRSSKEVGAAHSQASTAYGDMQQARLLKLESIESTLQSLISNLELPSIELEDENDNQPENDR